MSVPVTVKAQLADLSAKISTVGQARAAIGHATDVLSQGYGQLANVTDLAGLDDAAKSLLDQSNAYATKVYGMLETDDASQTRALTLTERLRAAEVVRECSEATASVIDATKVEFLSWDDFVTGFLTVVSAVGGAAGAVLELGGKGIAVLVWSFVRQAWPVLVAVVVVLVLLLYVRRRGLAAVKGALT